jgi:DNA-binding NarL/FixJ family response regulator
VTHGRPLRVLVVDDHEVVHLGFRLLLAKRPWVERCLSATDGEHALAAVRRYRPHVVLVDLFLGEESGTELTERLLAEAPGLRVILMSGSGRISEASARAAGAAGFVPKDWSAEEIVGAIRAVGQTPGRTVFGTRGPAATALTQREREVLSLIADGATNREIAGALNLSPHTIKDHTHVLFRKLGVRNRAEAAGRAGQLGIAR